MPRTFIATIEAASHEIPENRIRTEFTDRGASVEFHRSPAGTDLLEVCHRNRRFRVYTRTLSDGSKEIWINRYRVVVTLQDERHRRLSVFVRSGQSVSGEAVREKQPVWVLDVTQRPGYMFPQLAKK